MRKLLLTILTVTALGGCASTQQPLGMKSDWRAGADQSPYRSIPTALICDDCNLR